MAVGFRRDGKTTEAFGLQEENAWASDPAAKPTIADYLPDEDPGHLHRNADIETPFLHDSARNLVGSRVERKPA
jgi:hypothetical protein